MSPTAIHNISRFNAVLHLAPGSGRNLHLRGMCLCTSKTKCAKEWSIKSEDNDNSHSISHRIKRKSAHDHTKYGENVQILQCSASCPLKTIESLMVKLKVTKQTLTY